MDSNLESLLIKLIVLIGLMFSSNLLACAPETPSNNQTSLIQIQSSVLTVDFAKQTKETSPDNKTHHQHHEEKDKSHHECDCCEFCRCSSCTDCSTCASAALDLNEKTHLDEAVDSNLSTFKPFYISLSPTPLEHPPRLATFFLA